MNSQKLQTHPDQIIMKFFKLTALISAAAVVAGCVSPNYESESRYAANGMMVEQNAERCRVLDVRQVYINATPVRGSKLPVQGRYAQLGATAGAVGGAGIVKALGSDNPYAMLAGAVIGSALASQQGQRMDLRDPANYGLEYSIIRANGRESVITQPRSPSDRIVQPGQSCRIVYGYGGARILPAEHLPTSIAAPRVTRIK